MFSVCGTLLRGVMQRVWCDVTFVVLCSFVEYCAGLGVIVEVC